MELNEELVKNYIKVLRILGRFTDDANRMVNKNKLLQYSGLKAFEFDSVLDLMVERGVVEIIEDRFEGVKPTIFIKLRSPEEQLKKVS